METTVLKLAFWTNFLWFYNDGIGLWVAAGYNPSYIQFIISLFDYIRVVILVVWLLMLELFRQIGMNMCMQMYKKDSGCQVHTHTHKIWKRPPLQNPNTHIIFRVDEYEGLNMKGYQISQHMFSKIWEYVLLLL